MRVNYFQGRYGDIRNGQKDTQATSKPRRTRAVRGKLKQNFFKKAQFERALGVTGYSGESQTWLEVDQIKTEKDKPRKPAGTEEESWRGEDRKQAVGASGSRAYHEADDREKGEIRLGLVDST